MFVFVNSQFLTLGLVNVFAGLLPRIRSGQLSLGTERGSVVVASSV